MEVAYKETSMHAKATKSTSLLTHVQNEVDLIPLVCKDDKETVTVL